MRIGGPDAATSEPPRNRVVQQKPNSDDQRVAQAYRRLLQRLLEPHSQNKECSMSAATPGLAIEARNLVKTYPDGRGKPPLTALDGLSFGAETGTVFGLLGP